MANEFDTPNIEHKMKMFPCYVCLVKAACNDYCKCDLVTHNMYKIFKLLESGRCPDCGNKDITILSSIQYNCNVCNHSFRNVQGCRNLFKRV